MAKGGSAAHPTYNFAVIESGSEIVKLPEELPRNEDAEYLLNRRRSPGRTVT